MVTKLAQHSIVESKIPIKHLTTAKQSMTVYDWPRQRLWTDVIRQQIFLSNFSAAYTDSNYKLQYTGNSNNHMYMSLATLE